MNAQQLKNSILQLAVQGKLVPQDPNDEPASALIERIRAEKEKLIKEKKIKPDKNPSYIFRGSDNLPYEKVGKNEPVCIADEVPFDIPDSWEWVRLGSVLNVKGGKRLPKEHNLIDIPTNHIYIRVTDMKNHTISSEKLKYITEDTFQLIKNYIINKDDLYLTIAGTIGNVGMVPDKFDGMNLTENAVKLTDIKINKYYLLHIICSNYIQNQFVDKTNKVAQPKLAIERILTTLIPLPPLSEQQRIVDKLKELEPYINDYNKAYEKIEKLNTDFPDLLKKSILQEAVQGKLVPQDPNDEPASVLIEQIRQEKEQLIKDKKIKKDKNESYIFRRDNSHYEKIGTEERCIDDEIPFDIPDSWEWCTLASVTEQIHYGYTASAAPVGDAKLARITDIQDNKIMWETVPYCSISKENLPKYKLKNRDILIARTGGTIGKTYIVRNLNENAVFASYLIRAIPLQLVNEEYLKLFMESPLYWEQLKTYSMGTGQPNVNGQSLSKLRLPIPPLNEQQRIVEYYKNILPKIKDLK